MGRYQTFWNMASPLLNSMIQNPYNNSSYALNLSQQTNAAQTLGRQAMSNAFSNLRTMGMGDASSGLKAALGANMSRFGSALTQRGFMNAANQANADKWNALGIQASQSPLVTGQTQTQQKSGLGTWLPQVLGGAFGILSGLKGTNDNTNPSGGNMPNTSAFAGGAGDIFSSGLFNPAAMMQGGGAGAAAGLGAMPFFPPI